MAARGDLNAALAAEIKHCREQAGLTQEDVWTAAGLTRNVYRRLEWDVRTMSVEQMDAIAEALGIKGEDLFKAAKARLERGDIPPVPAAAAEWRRALGIDDT